MGFTMWVAPLTPAVSASIEYPATMVMSSGSLQRTLRRPLSRVRRHYDLAKSYAKEWPIRRQFERFYGDLPDKRQCFFMVFPPGLGHWLIRTSSCVPRDMNLVLVGMGLDPEEEACIREHIQRPLFHLPIKLDDQAVWQFLFDTADHDFGWIDMDLFVLTPAVLRAMADIAPDSSANCAWAYRSPWGHTVLSTHLLFVNTRAVRALRANGCRASPVVHTYDGSPLGRFFPGARSAIPTRRELRLLARVLPTDRHGRPAFPSNFEGKFWFQGFDTMVVYQLLCEALGYRLTRIRSLDGVPGSRGHYSDELVHIGALSYYAALRREASPRAQHYYRLLLQFDSLVLERSLRRWRLPSSYAGLASRLAERLEQEGLPARDRAANVRRHFEGCGLNADVFQHQAWQDLWS
jgi:hypothetical protein